MGDKIIVPKLEKPRPGRKGERSRNLPVSYSPFPNKNGSPNLPFSNSPFRAAFPIPLSAEFLVRYNSSPMNVVVNGEGRRLEAGTTVADLLRDLELEGRPVAVEINGATVAKGAYPKTELVEGDRVEIVGFVGGG